MTARLPILSRLSFRRLLLSVFLLIAILLSGTSVHALLTLERLSAHNRDTAQLAVRLTENAQLLGERSVAMERSARQFLVLDDPAFRQRYAEARGEARAALDALEAVLPAAAPELAEWKTRTDAAWSVLQAKNGKRGQKQQALNRALAQLPFVNERVASLARREVERRNNALLDELEQQRSLLTAQVIGSIALAALLAFGFGIWIARPLAGIEAAIKRLGENRFDQVIDVRGPTDLRRLGQHLDWLRRRLAELEQDKARFLRHISHELKTPLAALREGVALLEDEVVGELTHDQREVARILRQNTLSLQTQIEDLLRYNAATFDAQHLKREPVRLQELLQRTIESQRLQWQARRLTVEVDGSADPIRADPDKLAVVLGNLLSNAVRFSPDQGAIRFAVARHGAQLQLDCTDGGPGIAAPDAERVFEPFYQGQRQPPGARRGNGIGLSIVREYIAAHGGTIRLLPSATGAHFRIELPYDC
jgi:two-component system, NtrC family, sensor histidine kinase GlrK